MTAMTTSNSIKVKAERGRFIEFSGGGAGDTGRAANAKVMPPPEIVQSAIRYSCCIEPTAKYRFGSGQRVVARGDVLLAV
jgi:hypothetical protein